MMTVTKAYARVCSGSHRGSLFYTVVCTGRAHTLLPERPNKRQESSTPVAHAVERVAMHSSLAEPSLRQTSLQLSVSLGDMLKGAARKTSKFGRVMRVTTADGELNLEAAALGVLQSWATGDISFVVKPLPSPASAPGSGAWGSTAQPLLQALSSAQRDVLAAHNCVPDDKFDDFIVMEPAAVVPWHKTALDFDQLLETCRSIEQDDDEEDGEEDEEEEEEDQPPPNRKRKSAKSSQAEKSGAETGKKPQKKTKTGKSKSKPAGADAADDAYDFEQFF